MEPTGDLDKSSLLGMRRLKEAWRLKATQRLAAVWP